MATASESSTTVRAPDDRRWLFALSGLVFASIAFRLVVNTRFQAPTILTDELTYTLLARDIAAGNFSLANGYGIVYPLLMAPSWVLAEFGTTAYTLMQATNAVVISLTAVPVFLWARRMMQPRFALLAAGLTLAMPSMAYSGHIMTENAFVLAVTLAAWAIATAVERPTLLHQGLVLLALAAAFGTRAQAGILVIAVLIIVVLGVLAEERATGAFTWGGVARRLARWWPLGGLAAIGLIAVVGRSVLTDWRWNQLLQAYGVTADGQYTPAKALRYYVWHLGEATFALGVIPVAAVGILVGLWITNRLRSPAERAYVATTLIVALLVILQVGIFMSYWSERISERNMLCVFPLLLIGLALWLDAALPRSRWTAGIAAAVAGALVLCVPFAFVYGRSPSTETWAAVLPDILTRRLPGGADDVQILIVAGVAVALLVFGLLRERVALILIPVLLIAYFMAGQAAAVRIVGKTSAEFRNIPSLGADADWLDRAIPPGQEVAFLFGSSLGPDTDRLIGWETTFFNRRPYVVKTWDVDLVSDPLTGVVTTPDGGDADLPGLAITPSTRQLAGPVRVDRSAYVLQEPSLPYRVALSASGIYPDGWTGGTATIDLLAPGCSQATMRASRVPGTGATAVDVEVGTLAVLDDGALGFAASQSSTTAEVSEQAPAEIVVDVPDPPARIQITSGAPFSPAATGSPDTRELGVQIVFSCGDYRLG
jgi:hypothetical protein